MTGKDLIIYILENNLENEPIVKDGVFVGMVPIDELAVRREVSVGTIKAWVELGLLEGVTIGDTFYLFAKQRHPEQKKGE